MVAAIYQKPLLTRSRSPPALLKKSAVKIAVLISDAPPHGLDPPYSGRREGPFYDDMMWEAIMMARQGATLNAVGCESDIVPYCDFFMALAHISGGQFIRFNQLQKLIDAIIDGVKEELSLQRFSSDVQAEIQARDGPIDKAQIALSVYFKLARSRTQTMHLLLNSKPLNGTTSSAKAIAATR